MPSTSVGRTVVTSYPEPASPCIEFLLPRDKKNRETSQAFQPTLQGWKKKTKKTPTVYPGEKIKKTPTVYPGGRDFRLPLQFPHRVGAPHPSHAQASYKSPTWAVQSGPSGRMANPSRSTSLGVPTSSLFQEKHTESMELESANTGISCLHVCETHGITAEPRLDRTLLLLLLLHTP